MDKMSVYNRLPVVLQNVACGLEGTRINRTRYGKDFWRLLAEYESRANWSYDHLAEYRDAKLKKMIKHCYETVPYYTRLFDGGGGQPEFH
jgi:phenylacetate-CoA ligase